MIKYVKGDATDPCVKDGVRVIAHVCNDVGKFGSGFAACVAKRWGFVRDRYVEWSVTPAHVGLFTPGFVQVVPVGNSIYVANMVAQNGVRSANNPVPINYIALAHCLDKLYKWTVALKEVKTALSLPKLCPEITIHMPRIGCGLAGGRWELVEPLINVFIPSRQVYVYDLEE